MILILFFNPSLRDIILCSVLLVCQCAKPRQYIHYSLIFIAIISRRKLVAKTIFAECKICCRRQRIEFDFLVQTQIDCNGPVGTFQRALLNKTRSLNPKPLPFNEAIASCKGSAL